MLTRALFISLFLIPSGLLPAGSEAANRPPATPVSEEALAPLPAPPEEHVSFKTVLGTGRELTVHGIRFARPGAPVIDLQHGLYMTLESMRTLATELYWLGNEVWICNLPGHGTGSMRSVVKNSKKGDKNFRRMLVDYYPAKIQFIYDTINPPGTLPAEIRRVHTAGQSLGGILIKLFAGAVHETDAKLDENDEIRIARDALIEDVIAIGAPISLEDVREEMKFISKITLHVSKYIQGEIPSIGSIVNLAPVRPELAKKIRLAIAEMIKNTVIKTLPRYILNVNNLTDEEIVHLIAEWTSPVSADIGYSFNRWNLYGFKSKSGFSYERPRKILKPYLALAGDEDGLALLDSIHDDAVLRNQMRQDAIAAGDPHPHGEVHFAILRGTSHEIGLGIRSSRMQAELINKFIKRELVSPVDSPVELTAPSICERVFDGGASAKIKK